MKTKTKSAVKLKNTLSKSKGDLDAETEKTDAKKRRGSKAPSKNGNGKAIALLKSTGNVSSTCLELQALGRKRFQFMKSRIMSYNRIQAIVAGTIGYHTGMGDKERLAVFKQASGRPERRISPRLSVE